MLKCKDASRLVSKRQDTRLSPGEWLGMHLHLMICSGCRQFERQMDILRRLLRSGESGDRVELPQAARARIDSALKAHARHPPER
jgi:hypothetical protein